jgi:phosphate transport system substrate-binding protein
MRPCDRHAGIDRVKTNVVWRICALLLLACLSTAVVVHAAEPKSAHAAAKKSKGRSHEPPLPSLTWRGDYCTERAFMRDLARQFEADRQGQIVLQPFSTISGLDAVNDASADLAGSARPGMAGREEEKYTTFYPVAWDALVLITSPKNPASNVTLKQLHDIYLGRLTNWKELGGDDAPINLYANASPLDGIEYSFRDLIYHHGDQAVAVPRLYVNTTKLEEGVAIDPHGLGLSTLSGVFDNEKVKMLNVEGYGASAASVADGTYPLYAPLFLAARGDGRNSAEVTRFVTFATSDAAKAIMRKHDLVPYADALALAGKQDERVAFIDARVYPPAAAAAAPGETLVSAPDATTQSPIPAAPGSERAQAAKARAKEQKETKPDGG